jgi:hypothetical protein
MHYAFVSWLQFAILGLAMPAFLRTREVGSERGGLGGEREECPMM